MQIIDRKKSFNTKDISASLTRQNDKSFDFWKKQWDQAKLTDADCKHLADFVPKKDQSGSFKRNLIFNLDKHIQKLLHLLIDYSSLSRAHLSISTNSSLWNKILTSVKLHDNKKYKNRIKISLSYFAKYIGDAISLDDMFLRDVLLSYMKEELRLKIFDSEDELFHIINIFERHANISIRSFDQRAIYERLEFNHYFPQPLQQTSDAFKEERALISSKIQRKWDCKHSYDKIKDYEVILNNDTNVCSTTYAYQSEILSEINLRLFENVEPLENTLQLISKKWSHFFTKVEYQPIRDILNSIQNISDLEKIKQSPKLNEQLSNDSKFSDVKLIFYKNPSRKYSQ